MGQESAPKTSQEVLRDFYKFIAREMPEGLVGAENAYPVTIGRNQLSAIIFGVGRGQVSFGLFIAEGTYTPQETIAGTSGKYSRKTLEISETGEVREDTEGTIPNFDLTDNEPDFSGMSDNEIALQVVKQIQSFKRSEAH
jgi:hypothetical protein